METRQRPKKIKKSAEIMIMILFAFIFSLLIYYYPALETSKPSEQILIIDGQRINADIHLEKGEILLTPQTIKEHLDPFFYFDRNTETAIVTTKDKVLQMKTNQLTGYINSKEVKFQVPIRKLDETYYIPISVLAPLYQIEIAVYPESKSIVINSGDKPRQKAEIIAGHAYVREKSSLRSPRLTKLEKGEEVTVYGEENGWLRVVTDEGFTGFINEEKAVFTKISWKPYKYVKEHVPWRPLGGKIILTWDYAYCKPYLFNDAPPLSGANVVSPTWFHLADAEGNIKNEGFQPYVEWAHGKEMQVWALFSNSFDPDLTHAVLSSPQKREAVRDQLLVLAELYQLDGINFDFENIYYEDKDLLVQFIREIIPFLHEEGLTVSMDVTVLSSSGRWSLCYDREALAESVDYMMLMAYDQYPVGSSVAGPVSSLRWTEEKLKEVLQLVPNEKLVLGVPFYTRLWQEQKRQDGSIKVTQQALGMKAAEKILAERGIKPELDNETGLFYAQYEEGDATFKIWLETEESIKYRTELVKKYELAGIASWRRGFEKPEIWDVITTTIAKRP